ncbi:hypothetical protein C8F04DRAFT_210129 [Mycena alexandri]|uniref:Uncharacterized protein n=1 Tax=Mycena alexandri TaxID=1745969 RepID=A0AAD6TK46_9AGAR|nr:hypothetical protein C8F04DRAFT_210129 [Mycena alexandri]
MLSAEADHTILPNWYVSGLFQVVTDSSSRRTTGEITSYNAEHFAQTSITGEVGDNGDVNITVTATRKIQITPAHILSGSGKARRFFARFVTSKIFKQRPGSGMILISARHFSPYFLLSPHNLHLTRQ